MLWYNPNATIHLIFSSSSDVWLSIWCAAPIWWMAIHPTCSFPSDMQLSIRRAALRPMCSSPSDVQLSVRCSAFHPTCGSPPRRVALRPTKGLRRVVKLSEFRPTAWRAGRDVTETCLFADVIEFRKPSAGTHIVTVFAFTYTILYTYILLNFIQNLVGSNINI